MNDVLPLAGVFGAGLLLGAFYFGGLWWTVRKGVASTHPALWFLSSMVLRSGLVLVGFFFVGGGHWERFLACLLGFMICRVFVMRLTRSDKAPSTSPSQEAHHAS